MKLQVYGDRFNKAFENENESKKKNRKVWHEMSNPDDLSEIRKALKQFVPLKLRLKAFLICRPLSQNIT